MRAGGSSRVPAERGFGGGRSERRAGAARRRSNLPRHAMRNAVPVFRTRSDLLPFCERASTAGINAARTAVDPTDSRGAHEQGDRQSVLSVRANGEKPLVSNEAENRSRRSSGHCAGVPDAGVHALVFLVFSLQFLVLGSSFSAPRVTDASTSSHPIFPIRLGPSTLNAIRG